jgi:hypothetical protein
MHNKPPMEAIFWQDIKMMLKQFDYWIAKLNSNADIEWEKTYGRVVVIDEAKNIQQTIDGGYIVGFILLAIMACNQ